MKSGRVEESRAVGHWGGGGGGGGGGVLGGRESGVKNGEWRAEYA